MEKLMRILMLLCCVMLMPTAAWSFDSGSTGEDGVFSPQSDIEVVLPESGVLNYTTVNVPAGVTVTFKKNTSNTPVYMLATGDVTIAGKIDASGTPANVMVNGSGGPGGADGGLGGVPGKCGGAGLGSGGGKPGVMVNIQYGANGGGGSFGTLGETGWRQNNTTSFSSPGTTGDLYGNEELIPLIGGSGGSGGCSVVGYYAGAGGGGGGAILIASSTTINLTGEIIANGGRGANGAQRPNYYDYQNPGAGGGGSGGSVRLMANRIEGGGSISAAGGTRGDVWNRYSWSSRAGNGGSGRIRVESGEMAFLGSTTPSSYSYSAVSAPVFPAETPVLKIVSIGGVNIPNLPTGSFKSPDIILSRDLANAVDVVVEASSIPVGTEVIVEARPELGGIRTASAALSGTDLASAATATLSMDMESVSVITVTATFSYQTASNPLPLYVEGERVEKVRVTASLGGAYTVTYITESGREIAAAMLRLG